jgi:hypothetical protein
LSLVGMVRSRNQTMEFVFKYLHVCTQMKGQKRSELNCGSSSRFHTSLAKLS